MDYSCTPEMFSNHTMERVSYDSIKHILPVLPSVTNKFVIKPDTPSEALYEATQVLPFVSDERASQRDSWTTIGRILYKISNHTRDGLDAWITFSKRSTMFTEDDCSTIWSTFTVSHDSIQTLFSYAKQDNQDSYLIYKNTQGKIKLLQLITSNGFEIFEEDVANVLYILYKDEFLYYNGSWYQLQENIWTQVKDVIELRSRIPKLIPFMTEGIKNNRNELEALEKKVRDIEDEEDGEEEESKEKTEIILALHKKIKEVESNRTNLIKIRRQLKKSSFKNVTITECKDSFFDTTRILESLYKESIVKNKCLSQHATTVEVKEKNVPHINDTIIEHKQHVSYDNGPNSMISIPMIKIRNQPSYVDCSITTTLNELHWNPSHKYKRVAEIIKYCNFKKSSATSQRVKEYFIQNNIKIEEDKIRGHKVYIDY